MARDTNPHNHRDSRYQSPSAGRIAVSAGLMLGVCPAAMAGVLQVPSMTADPFWVVVALLLSFAAGCFSTSKFDFFSGWSAFKADSAFNLIDSAADEAVQNWSGPTHRHGSSETPRPDRAFDDLELQQLLLNSRVLLVEESRANRLIYSEFLRRDGYSVEAVANGREAADRLRERTYELLVVDLEAPGLNGLELCELIRVGVLGKKARNMPIILLTSVIGRLRFADAKRLNVGRVLVKPTARDVLADAAHGLTGRGMGIGVSVSRDDDTIVRSRDHEAW